MPLWPCQITDWITDGPRKIQRVIKNFGAKFKNYRRIFNTLPTDSIKIIIIFIYVGESISKTALYVPATAPSVYFFVSFVFHLKISIFFLSILQGFHLESLASFVVNLHRIKRYVFFLISFHFILFYFSFGYFYYCYVFFLVNCFVM